VGNTTTHTVSITSQNHGFTVDKNSLPHTIEATHFSLFDKTLQGISHTQYPAFSVQGHPEASPGTHDWQKTFARFIALMQHS